MLCPVILCGGSGARLWPLSNPDSPKQFLRLTGPQSLLQETMARVAMLPHQPGEPILVGGAAHTDQIRQQLRDVGVRPRVIVEEPEGRNTAPAIALAAELLVNDAPDALLLVMPADHIIGDPHGFADAVEKGIDAASGGSLVTFGITPQTPETGYGYIKKGSSSGSHFAVAAFTEKPDFETAERFIQDGGYLWNSGIFLFKAGAFLEELQKFSPDTVELCREAVRDGSGEGEVFKPKIEPFLRCVSDSIDFAVMEKTERAAVVEMSVDWSDVGSWDALYDALSDHESEDVTIGDVLARETGNSILVGDGVKLVTVGVKDLIVVSTRDAVLVMPRGRSQDVKEIVQMVAEADTRKGE